MSSRLVSPTLAQLLADLPGMVPLERVDRIWVFPPRVLGEVESGLLVLSLLAEEGGDDGQREVMTVQYELRTGKGGGSTREMTSRGWAPAERVAQVIAGVVRRLGSEEEEPTSEVIEGDAEAYARFTGGLGAGVVDPANGE